MTCSFVLVVFRIVRSVGFGTGAVMLAAAAVAALGAARAGGRDPRGGHGGSVLLRHPDRTRS